MPIFSPIPSVGDLLNAENYNFLQSSLKEKLTDISEALQSNQDTWAMILVSWATTVPIHRGGITRHRLAQEFGPNFNDFKYAEETSRLKYINRIDDEMDLMADLQAQDHNLFGESKI